MDKTDRASAVCSVASSQFKSGPELKHGDVVASARAPPEPLEFRCSIFTFLLLLPGLMC